MNKTDIETVLLNKGFTITYNTSIITIAVKGDEKTTIRFTHSGSCVGIICERIDTSDSLKINAKEKYGTVISTELRGDDLVFTMQKSTYRAEIIL